MAKPRSAFKLKLLAGIVAADLLGMRKRAKRFELALAYVASRETHDYRGVPVRRGGEMGSP
jgi:hypothetical protein